MFSVIVLVRIRSGDVSSVITRLPISSSFRPAITASEGARPKPRTKPIFDPDFIFEGLPVKPLFSDDPLEQQFDAAAHPRKHASSVLSSAKSKATVSPAHADVRSIGET